MLSWNTCCIQSGLCKLSSLSLALSVSVKPYRALSLSVFLLLTHQRTTSRLPLFAFTWSGRVLRASFFLTCCSRRTICCIESAAHICFIPRMWTVQLRFFGFYKTYSPSCVPEELLKSTDVAVPEWKLTANDSDHCKRSHFWVGQIEFCDDFITIEQLRSSKQKSIALRLVSSLSHPLFFSPLSWWRIDLNLMMFVMKRKSQTNYIKELWSPVPCLSEHVMIW